MSSGRGGSGSYRGPRGGPGGGRGGNSGPRRDGGYGGYGGGGHYGPPIDRNRFDDGSGGNDPRAGNTNNYGGRYDRDGGAGAAANTGGNPNNRYDGSSGGNANNRYDSGNNTSSSRYDSGVHSSRYDSGNNSSRYDSGNNNSRYESGGGGNNSSRYDSGGSGSSRYDSAGSRRYDSGGGTNPNSGNYGPNSGNYGPSTGNYGPNVGTGAHYRPSGGVGGGSAYGVGGYEGVRYGASAQGAGGSYDRGGGGNRYGANDDVSGRDFGGGGRSFGNDRDGGRGGRGGGGRGGRGGKRGPQFDPAHVQSVLTNIILAAPTPNFSFYLYTVHCLDNNHHPIDSRLRRRQLFEAGLWDGLLRNTLSHREKEDLQRVVFFAGAYFFSGRAIPQLDAANLPITLCDGTTTDGDVMRVLQVLHYTTPTELRNEEPSLSSLSSSNTIPPSLATAACDLRCSQCTKSFSDAGALVQHCSDTGHPPVYNTNANEIAPSQAEPIRAQLEVFTAFVNLALSRALSERFARWGHDFIDPQSCKEPTDTKTGKSLGVRVFEAYSCQFGVVRAPDPCLELTVDLRAKVVRTASVLDQLYDGRDPYNYRFNPREQDDLRRRFKSEVVIYMTDKRCYSVVDLVFEHSPDTLMVDGIGISHTTYFRERKDTMLKYPGCVPMVAVLGRRNQTIFLPPELIAFNELHPHVKQKLPSIASFPPEDRNKCIEKIRQFLIPGAQKSRGISGLLPALGITLKNDRLSAKAEVLAMPTLFAAGLRLPNDQGENWTNSLRSAKFNVNPNHVINLNVVLICNSSIRPNAVYGTIRDMVNKFNTRYRFGRDPYCVIDAGNSDPQHWGAVENFFSGKDVPSNIFVVDFTFPRQAMDSAYPVVKRMLCGKGYLSQFVNFKTFRHDNVGDDKRGRSTIILGGVARQILQKCGVRIWWVDIPKSLPLPSIFVGVDVFHSPRVYDERENKRVGKNSCAAIIIQVIREGSEAMDHIEMYTKTYKRAPGKEYELGDALEKTITDAMRELEVRPASCVIWRDGIGDTAFDHALEEIKGIRAALTSSRPEVGSNKSGKWEVPLSYIVCQKRIATKLFTRGIPGQPDGKFGAPPGTLVEDIQGLRHYSFYINGRAPPYSTAKPVRFIVAEQDEAMKDVSIPHLTWQQSHDYPNWAGPIKVPSVCQLAHKLAELAGGFTDCGESIDDTKFKNTIYCL